MTAEQISGRGPEVNRWQDDEADYYCGTKKALIAAGICVPEWFPKQLLPELKRDGTPWRRYGKARVRRKYLVEGRKPTTTLTHKLDAFGVERWVVRIEDEERARLAQQESERQAERWKWERVQRAKEEAEREAREARIPEIIRSLPPFVPGSLSEAEKHFMRLVRALSDDMQDLLLDIATQGLARDPKKRIGEWAIWPADEPAEETDVEQGASVKPPLRLVVNNSKP